MSYSDYTLPLSAHARFTPTSSSSRSSFMDSLSASLSAHPMWAGAGALTLSGVGWVLYKILTAEDPRQAMMRAKRARMAKQKAKGKGGKGGKGGRKAELSLSAEAAKQAAAAVDEEEEEEEVRTPVGLKNVGNSCYLNAVLQALQSSAPFVAYLEHLRSLALQVSMRPPAPLYLDAYAAAAASSSSSHNSSSDPSHGSMRTSPLDFLTTLLQLVAPRAANGSHSSSSLNPYQFSQKLQAEASGKFRGFNQEDAHELLHVLLDILEKKAQLTIKQVQANKRHEEVARNYNERGVTAVDASGLEALLQEASQPQQQVDAKTGLKNGSNPTTNGVHTDPSVEETDCDSSNEASPSSSLHSSGLLSSASNASVSSTASAASPSASSPSSSSSPSVFLPGAPSSFSFPTDPLQGLLAHFLICSSCHRSSSASVNHSLFTSLTLNFGDMAAIYGGAPSVSSGPPPTLEDLLATYVKPERVDGVRCEHCNWQARRKLVADKLSQMMQAQAAGMAPKSGKAARKYAAFIDYLRKLQEELELRCALMQPNAGQLLQRQRKQEERMERKRKGMAQASSSSSFTSEISPSPSSPTAASSSDSFLNPVPPTDSLLSPLFSPTLDVWSHLSDQFTSPDFTSQFPSSSSSSLFSSLLTLDTRRPFSKSTCFRRLPPVLVLHLNRLLGPTKLTQHVAFPLRLAMDRYSANQEEKVINMALSQEGANADKLQRLIMERMQQRMQGTAAASATDLSQMQLYELDAVVVHQGSAHSGHYITYRRQVQRAKGRKQQPAASNGIEFAEENGVSELPDASPPAPIPAPIPAPPAASPSSSSSSSSLPPMVSSRDSVTWWYMSDAHFHQVEAEEVLRAQAYLLFYTKVNPVQL